jgi:ribosome modulation factor
MNSYDQGFAARREGRTLEENPFAPGSRDHLAWLSGWRDLDLHYRERDEVFPNW